MCNSCGSQTPTYPCCHWPCHCGCGCGCHEPMPIMARQSIDELFEESSRCGGHHSGCGCGSSNSGCGCGNSNSGCGCG